MSTPDWLVLIRHWTHRNVGYALPFLVGARARLAGQSVVTEQDALKLLDEMFNPPADSDVLQLIWCDNLAAPVFGLKKHQIPGIEFASRLSGRPSILVRSDLVAKWGDKVEDVANGVVTECKDSIGQQLFSRTWRKTWEDFTEEEAQRIDNLLKRQKLG
jgi:hypothetical protein